MVQGKLKPAADRYEIKLTKVIIVLAILATVIFYLKIPFIGFITAVVLSITTVVLSLKMVSHHIDRELEWKEKQQQIEV